MNVQRAHGQINKGIIQLLLGGGGVEILNSTNYVGLFDFPSALCLLYLFHTLPAWSKIFI